MATAAAACPLATCAARHADSARRQWRQRRQRTAPSVVRGRCGAPCCRVPMARHAPLRLQPTGARLAAWRCAFHARGAHYTRQGRTAAAHHTTHTHTTHTPQVMTNALLARKQMVVDVVHPGSAPASKTVIRDNLAKLHKCDAKTIIVYGFSTAFGGGRSSGFALIYNSVDEMKKFEPRCGWGAGMRVRQTIERAGRTSTPRRPTPHPTPPLPPSPGTGCCAWSSARRRRARASSGRTSRRRSASRGARASGRRRARRARPPRAKRRDGGGGGHGGRVLRLSTCFWGVRGRSCLYAH